MVIDTSAVVAALTAEADADRYRRAITAAGRCVMSALTVYEARIVLGMRHGDGVVREFELLLAKAPVAVHPFDEEQAVLAFEAYRRFGKGGGHPARLNMGDCAAYALARRLGLPLLFKGDDFARTDVPRALA